MGTGPGTFDRMDRDAALALCRELREKLPEMREGTRAALAEYRRRRRTGNFRPEDWPFLDRDGWGQGGEPCRAEWREVLNGMVPPLLSEREEEDFRYLQACYGLGVRPAGCFTGDGAVCAEVMKRGGGPVEMYREGSDPLYAALLSNPFLDREIMLRTVDLRIPF